MIRLPSKAAIPALLIASLLPACATQPTPQEVCSAEWIEVRADRAMAEFERDVRPMLRTFERAGNRLEGSNGDISPLLMVQVMSAATRFAEKLENSQALDDLQRLSEQCDDPDLMLDAVSGLLEKRGAPPQVIRIMRDMKDLQRMSEDGRL